MCACGSAYDINPQTCQYSPDTVFAPAVKYVSTPQPITADNINACLLGQNSDGIIVAFRGTLPPDLHSALSLHDWLLDFFDVPKTVSTGPGKVPGQVHCGFYDAVACIIESIAKGIRILDPGLTIPVYVTGHSKGGAMASIGAYILSQGYGIPIQQVVTFASPRPGDSGFKAGYETVIPNQIRYENYGDLVPLLPPSNTPVDLIASILGHIPVFGPDIAKAFNDAKDWDYGPVGALEFIESSTKNYQITPNVSLDVQVFDVLDEIGRDAFAGNFTSIGDAHTLACGYGYMHGVCPTGVCGT